MTFRNTRLWLVDTLLDLWHRHVVGGLHDHEEGDGREDCSGCIYERETRNP